MSTPQAPNIRIFVSHSSSDNEFGIRLSDDLRRVLGDPTAVWFDSAGGLQAGDAWWRTIVAEVTARPIFLVIWSPDAQASSWVNDEIDLAWQQKNDPGGKRIIPLLYRPCSLREDLRTRHVISFTTPQEYERGFSALLAALGLSLAPTPEPAQASASPPATPPRAVPSVPSQGSAPAALLLFSIDGYWPSWRVPLREPSTTVGRESGNDVLVSDPAISRFHLRLTREGAGWLVEIIPGAKPLYINGEAREMARLGPNDQLVIGGTVLRLEQPSVTTGSVLTGQTDARTILASGLTPELVVEGSNLRFTAPLRREVVTLGRAPDSTIVIPSPLVAAHQAVLHRGQIGTYEFEGSQEAPNTFALNGHPVKRYTLRHGDTLTLGARAQSLFVAVTYLAAGSLDLLPR